MSPSTPALAEQSTAATVPAANVADPCAMVIFGAAGDLTKRKLMPALLNLRRSGLLPEGFTIVAVARTEIGQGEFRERLLADLASFAAPELDSAERAWFAERIRYVRGDFQDARLYAQLTATLEEVGAVVRFVMSEEASYVNGVALPVDGGLTA